ncbi:MAG: hypothetical protein LBQ66_12605 [Planctomycetaceae bacterium]|nr:hypothetical protein [Planctomycetaceae bacterium]
MYSRIEADRHTCFNTIVEKLKLTTQHTTSEHQTKESKTYFLSSSTWRGQLRFLFPFRDFCDHVKIILRSCQNNYTAFKLAAFKSAKLKSAKLKFQRPPSRKG